MLEKLVQAQLVTEAKKTKISVKDYIGKPQAMDNFLITLAEKTSDAYLDKLSSDELILLSMELGIRFQMQTRVRFPNLAKQDQAEKMLNEKLM